MVQRNRVLFSVLLLTGVVTDYANQSLEYSSVLDRKIYEKVGKHHSYAALFTTNTKNHILYLAVDHTIDEDSETFLLIKTAYQYFKPTVVILEGLQKSCGYSPLFFKRFREEKRAHNLNRLEIEYTADLADSNNVQFIGAEPDDQLIFNDLTINDNYTEQDVAFFYFTRQIPQIVCEKNIEVFQDLLWEHKFTQYMAKELPQEYYFRYDDYKAWLIKHCGVIHYHDLIKRSFCNPDKNGNFIQRISHKVCAIRDKYIVEVITGLACKSSRVLVVYGSSHLAIQYDFLTEAFNTPLFFKDEKALATIFK
ncbi:MAG: hypothetical protein LVQ75_00060 [Candidatus Babeliales bacterium]